MVRATEKSFADGTLITGLIFYRVATTKNRDSHTPISLRVYGVAMKMRLKNSPTREIRLHNASKCDKEKHQTAIELFKAQRILSKAYDEGTQHEFNFQVLLNETSDLISS